MYKNYYQEYSYYTITYYNNYHKNINFGLSVTSQECFKNRDDFLRVVMLEGAAVTVTCSKAFKTLFAGFSE